MSHQYRPSLSIYRHEVAKLAGHVLDAVEDLSNTHTAAQVLPYAVEITHGKNDPSLLELNILVTSVLSDQTTRLTVQYNYAVGFSKPSCVDLTYVGDVESDTTSVAQSIAFALVVHAVKNGFTADRVVHVNL